jgi:hypothetical protein
MREGFEPMNDEKMTCKEVEETLIKLIKDNGLIG